MHKKVFKCQTGAFCQNHRTLVQFLICPWEVGLLWSSLWSLATVKGWTHTAPQIRTGQLKETR